MLKGTNKRFLELTRTKKNKKETTMLLVEDKLNMYSRPFLDILC